LNKAALENGIPLLEATLRWMRHHSSLEAKDGIIVGASSVKHMEDNLANLEKDPLPSSMIDDFDEAWEKVKPSAMSYFRTSETRFGVPKQ
jgi:aflatoxin B1 aldehyde reductase